MFRLYVILLLPLAIVITQCKGLGIKELNEVVREQQEMLEELQGLVLHQQGIINKLTSGKLPNKVSLLYYMSWCNITHYPAIIMIALSCYRSITELNWMIQKRFTVIRLLIEFPWQSFVKMLVLESLFVSFNMIAIEFSLSYTILTTFAIKASLCS